MTEWITPLTWVGIVVCLSQSAIFSGLNLAMFGVSRLRLEVEATGGSREAASLLALRSDANFLLTTILWGNVAINTLLALLSESVLAGVGAFFFSTVAITILGEITPQAYFSRNALRMASLLAPVLRAYQVVLYPVAKPTAKILDRWLGQEGVRYFLERDLREVIKKHVEAEDADIEHLEGIGALNFLTIDDLTVSQEGQSVDPASVVTLPIEGGKVEFPRFDKSPSDPFLQLVEASGKKWVIVTDSSNEPRLLLDADGFLRDALFGDADVNPRAHCHRPIIVRDMHARLGDVISRMKVEVGESGDNVIDQDVILIWGEDRRVITGSDLLGHLLHGIVIREPPPSS